MLTGKRIMTVLAITLLGIGQVLSAEDALSIIRKVDEKQASDTSRTEMVMRTYPDAHDESNYREFAIAGYGRGEDESYMEFLAPRTIKGLKILGKGDDNWVFFPSTGRVRKIAGKSKGESVQGVGGDFSYEDLGGGKLEEKYSFSILSSGSNEWVLEGATKKEDSVYSKIVITIAMSNYLPTKIEYYTTKDGHLKDLVMNEVKMIDGRETATRILMMNIKKESKTLVILKAARYGISVPENLLNPNQFYK